MRIAYYPDFIIGHRDNHLNKMIENDLHKQCPKQWYPMIIFLKKLEQMSENEWYDLLLVEQRKRHENRQIESLGNGMYEYRGKHNRECTIRIYFSVCGDIVSILDAESKTGGKTKINRARKRRKKTS